MKPSKIKKIVAKVNKFICCLPWIKGMTLFGVVYTRKQQYADEINADVMTVFKNHEKTHVKQAVSCHDSWILFYLKYGWGWLMNLPLIFIDSNAPYKFIPFELEAYSNQDNLSYSDRNEATEWKKWKTIKLKVRKSYAKSYYKDYRKVMSFTEFINEFMKPKIYY